MRTLTGPVVPWDKWRKKKKGRGNKNTILHLRQVQSFFCLLLVQFLWTSERGTFLPNRERIIKAIQVRVRENLLNGIHVFGTLKGPGRGLHHSYLSHAVGFLSRFTCSKLVSWRSILQGLWGLKSWQVFCGAVEFPLGKHLMHVSHSSRWTRSSSRLHPSVQSKSASLHCKVGETWKETGECWTVSIKLQLSPWCKLVWLLFSLPYYSWAQTDVQNTGLSPTAHSWQSSVDANAWKEKK